MTTKGTPKRAPQAATYETSEARPTKSARKTDVEGGGAASRLLNYPEWEKPYIAAMMEDDRPKRAGKIAKAKRAINRRMGGDDGEERAAILAAMNALKLLAGTTSSAERTSLENCAYTGSDDPDAENVI